MLREAIPSDVYVDTNVLVNTLIEGMAQSELCYEAYERLVVEQARVYISHLTRLEFLEALRGLANKTSLPQQFRDRFALDDWGNFMVRQRWLEFWADKFDELLSSFDTVYELPYRNRLWHRLPAHMALGPMRAYDAFHLATALSYRIPELWTTDSDFRNASGIRVRILRAT